MHVVYRGGLVKGGGVASGGGWASRRWVLFAIRALTVVLCPQQVTDMCTTHRMDQDEHCQQFDTTPTLISAHQWPHRLYNAPIWLYKVSKKPSVKADLAMYSHTVNVSSMSVSLILGCKLDFSSCAIRASFHKSSHIQIPMIDYVIKTKIYYFNEARGCL